jgi:hypothetical protein
MGFAILDSFRGPDVSPHPQGAALPARADPARGRQRRPDIPNRPLIAASVVAPALLALYFLALPLMPEVLREPGSPALYLIGVVGTLLLLVSAVFVAVKRTGRGGSPVPWFIAHVGGGMVGFVLVAVHTTGKFDRPPALLLLNLLALMALGVWARVRANRSMADTFGTKLGGFKAPDPAKRGALAHILAEKEALLERLDPMAREATFSVTLGHLVRSPAAALAYLRLVRAEERLMGTRGSVGAAQAWWRPLHLALAATFVVGVSIHIVMVTFFAGYVADGGPVTWWHLTAWNF